MKSPLDLGLALWERYRFARARRVGYARLRHWTAYYHGRNGEGLDGRDPLLFEQLEAINRDFVSWLDPGEVVAPPAGSITEEEGFLSFPSPRPVGDARVDRVRLRVYPAPAEAPEVGVLFHHWVCLEDWRHVEFLLRPLIGRCRVAAMLAPHHLQRRRDGWRAGEGVLNANPLDVFRAFRQWQADHAACLRLLARDHGFRRAVLVGYSFGGYGSLLSFLNGPSLPLVAVSVTNNYRRGVLEGPTTGHIRRRVLEAGFSPESFGRAVRSLHLARWADRIDGRRITWIRARYDRIEPRDSNLEAPRALRPGREVVLPGGHASAVLFRRRIAREALARVAEEASVAPAGAPETLAPAGLASRISAP
jgi:hypothetical protein